MSSDPARLLGVGALIAGAVTAAVFLLPKVFTFAAGPEVELITLLKKAEAKGLELEVPDAGTLYSKQVFYERMQITVDPATHSARVNCTLDFTGHLDATEVSSLGLERVVFTSGKGNDDWAPATNLAPRLVRVVGALEARRRALESGDREALAVLDPSTADGGALPPGVGEIFAVHDRRYRALAWLIRFEREGATVTEDFRLDGNAPDRPVDQKGSVRLFVDPDREFLFPHGLM